MTQSQASLAAIETDIRKAVIRSPIDGIVLDRQVDPGQTVAASFQTPTLFTLAEDLTKMKLIIDVDEADIGMVRVGQPARFRVDAYPDRIVRVEGQGSAQHAQDLQRRRDVSDGSDRRQLRAAAAAGHDGHGGNHGDASEDAMLVPNAALAVHSAGGLPDQRRRVPVPPRPPGLARRDRSAENDCAARLDAER